MELRDKLWSRRGVLGLGAVAPLVIGTTVMGPATAEATAPADSGGTVVPPEGRRILISCKLSMIAKEIEGRPLSATERLNLAGEAGFDGVDFDEAGNFSPAEVRDAVIESGVFVHNAINHDHWRYRLTSADPAERAKGVANIAHCIRVAHAAGGSGVLIVLGHGKDGSPEVVAERCRAEVEKLLPLAASLGQPILFENVWNQMFYDHDAPPEQSAQRFVQFVNGFESPWVGWYYDIGNHWKYGQPGTWIRELGRQCIKLDVKGFSRADDKFTDIGHGDLPWDQVREALADIRFAGWATAEVTGGGLQRLIEVRKQMQQAFGV